VCANCDTVLLTTPNGQSPIGAITEAQIDSGLPATVSLPTAFVPVSSTTKALHDPHGVIPGTIEAVLAKLEMVQQRLKLCNLADIEEQKHLCKLIKMYTETLKSLKKIQ